MTPIRLTAIKSQRFSVERCTAISQPGEPDCGVRLWSPALEPPRWWLMSGRRGARGERERMGRPGRRVLIGAAVVLVLLVGVVAWSTYHWFVAPAVVTDRPGPADAVVMFGGAGARFPEAVRLAEGGTAPW